MPSPVTFSVSPFSPADSDLSIDSGRTRMQAIPLSDKLELELDQDICEVACAPVDKLEHALEVTRDIRSCLGRRDLTFVKLLELQDRLQRELAVVRSVPRALEQRDVIKEFQELAFLLRRALVRDPHERTRYLPLGIQLSEVNQYSFPQLEAAKAIAFAYKKYLGKEVNWDFDQYFERLTARMIEVNAESRRRRLAQHAG